MSILRITAKKTLVQLGRLLGRKISVLPLNSGLNKNGAIYNEPIRSGYASIVDSGYGHARSKQLQQSVDQNNNPLPWFTYPAIEYIRQLDLKEKIVFEWGSGNSSSFFSPRVQQLFSAEHSVDWFNKVKSLDLSNHIIVNACDDDYVSAISRFGVKFDIIVIDGVLRDLCAAIAPSCLNKGGMIILDNADRYPSIGKLFREQDFIQVDMHGLGPINDYTWTTSFFFSRSFNFQPINGIQPVVPIGGGY